MQGEDGKVSDALGGNRNLYKILRGFTRVRILHVLDFYGPQGGLHFYLKRLKDLLHERYGVQMYFVAREQTPYRLDQHLIELDVPHFNGHKLIEWIKSISPDIIHFHDSVDIEVMRFCQQHFPVVRTVHDNELFCPNMFFINQSICNQSLTSMCAQKGCISTDVLNDYTERIQIYKKFNFITYFSDSIHDRLLAYGFNSDKIVKIPTLIDTKSKNDYVPIDEDNIILFTGRVVEYKGVEFLIRAVARLTHKNWKVVLAGTGDTIYVKKLVKLCVQLGISDKISFVGHLMRSELESYLARAKVFVFPSIGHEGYGYSGADARSFGIPIVAFDVGGVEEWLIDGYNGYIVPVKDVDAMAKAIDKILLDGSLFNRLRENAYTWNRDYPSVESQIDSMYHFYSKII